MTIRLDTLLLHLDDETEWQTIDEFWSAWSPRLNDRIKQLILRCQLREAQLEEACEIAKRNMFPLAAILAVDSKGLTSSVVTIDSKRLHEDHARIDELAKYSSQPR